MIIGAIAGLASIAKVLYEIISDVNEGKRMKQLADSHNDLLRITKEETEQFLTLSDVTYDIFDNFRDIVCEHHKLDLSNDASIISENIITKYVETSQSEIFHILSNRIPDNFDFLRDFNQFCQDINSDVEFCKKLSFSSMIEFQNSRLVLEKETNALILRTKVRMPILAEDYPSKTLSLFKTLNIGFYDENLNLSKISLPKLVIKSDSVVYGLTEKCENGICFMNSLTRNSKSVCAQSVFKGNTENCDLEIVPEKYVCDFIQVPGLGSIVTAKKARFSEKSDDLISVSKIITDSTYFFEKDGQLECYSEIGSSFHRLMTHRGAKFSLKTPKTIELTMNVSKMSILDNNQQKMRQIVNDLKTFHDNEYYKIGSFDVSDDNIACYSILAFILLLLIVLFAFFCRTKNIISKIPKTVLRNLK